MEQGQAEVAAQERDTRAAANVLRKQLDHKEMELGLVRQQLDAEKQQLQLSQLEVADGADRDAEHVLEVDK